VIDRLTWDESPRISLLYGTKGIRALAAGIISDPRRLESPGAWAMMCVLSKPDEIVQNLLAPSFF
jgi:hypothetical protein